MVLVEVVVVVGVVCVGVWGLNRYLNRGSQKKLDEIRARREQRQSDDDDDLVGSR